MDMLYKQEAHVWVPQSKSVPSNMYILTQILSAIFIFTAQSQIKEGQRMADRRSQSTDWAQKLM